MKFFTTAVAGADGQTMPVQMVGHSPFVTTLETLGFPGDVSRAFAGVAGDVRDADCADAGTDAFSAAYSTTRTVAAPYEPQDCETIDETIIDGEGEVIGHVVTTHVPGFWVDLEWPLAASALETTPGHALPEVWYGAVYDTDGTATGDWYTEVDDAGQSASVFSPGQYLEVFSLSATPGGMAEPECHAWIPENVPNSFDQITLTVSDEQVATLQAAGAKGFTVALYPKLDWDLFVDAPGGQSGSAGNFVAHESIDFPLRAGDYRIRGCNFAGEPEVHGAVVVRY
jgi:hypothetical protein